MQVSGVTYADIDQLENVSPGSRVAIGHKCFAGSLSLRFSCLSFSTLVLPIQLVNAVGNIPRGDIEAKYTDDDL